MSNVPAVLIVEDDLATQQLLGAVVRRNHFRGEVAGDGRAALQQIAATDFAVILIDLILPIVDGFEVLRQVSDTTPHLLRRIIVITAAAEATYSGCVPLRSVWYLLRKPFELSMLEEQMLLCCAARPARAAESPL